ncbi:hypothetical protein FOXYSP1_19445 [Fusarium oxysporum f. sp. phaseoli]
MSGPALDPPGKVLKKDYCRYTQNKMSHGRIYTRWNYCDQKPLFWSTASGGGNERHLPFALAIVSRCSFIISYPIQGP